MEENFVHIFISRYKIAVALFPLLLYFFFLLCLIDFPFDILFPYLALSHYLVCLYFSFDALFSCLALSSCVALYALIEIIENHGAHVEFKGNPAV